MTKRVHGVRSPIEEAEREEAISDWLAAHGMDVVIAVELAETAVTIESLDMLAKAVDGPALNAVLRWAAAGCSVRGLASEIQDAAMRISGLVSAIKGFTYMDQAKVAEPVDLERSLGNTVAVLKSKARGKSVAVDVEVEPGLPHARGFGGELNQIWANLIDNALDALAEGGRMQAIAKREGQRVVVRIVDNGSGIPKRSSTGFSTHSSRRSRWDPGRGWASTLSGGWCGTMTERFPWSHSPAAQSSASPCRLREPMASEDCRE